MTINKDLLREREKCIFNPLELTHLLDGGEEKTTKRRKIGKTEKIQTAQSDLKNNELQVYSNKVSISNGKVTKSEKYFSIFRGIFSQ